MADDEGKFLGTEKTLEKDVMVLNKVDGEVGMETPFQNFVIFCAVRETVATKILGEGVSNKSCELVSLLYLAPLRGRRFLFSLVQEAASRTSVPLVGKTLMKQESVDIDEFAVAFPSITIAGSTHDQRNDDIDSTHTEL